MNTGSKLRKYLLHSGSAASYANVLKAINMPVQGDLPNNGLNPISSPKARDETPNLIYMDLKKQ